MHLLDLTLPDAAANLALDEALLLGAEESEGPALLRLWEQSTRAVIVGAGGSVAHDVNVAACEIDGVPILRRASGGGTVVIGPGCLCFSLVLPYDFAPALVDIRVSNRYILGRVAAALRPVATASFEGTSDLAVGGVKISGNAQQRKRRYFLHHGTILFGFDIEQLSTYLLAPERQPDYRRNRPHGDFVMNVPATSATLKQLLIAEWHAGCGYGDVPWESMHQLVAEKYSRAEWNRRR
jgi:lipoate-protein ligase A